MEASATDSAESTGGFVGEPVEPAGAPSTTAMTPAPPPSSTVSGASAAMRRAGRSVARRTAGVLKGIRGAGGEVSATAHVGSVALNGEAASGPSTTLVAGASPSATAASDDISVSSIQVRQISMKGSQEAALTLPDGDSRVVIENRIGNALVRMGGHYSFYNGRIEAWVTYAHPLWEQGPLLQVAGSDHVGLGQLYYHERSLERAREVPVAVGRQFRYGSALLSASRTAWLLAPLDDPARMERGKIDAISAQFTTTDVIPDVAERLAFLPPDVSAFEYKRAFRNFGADFGFERVSGDFRYYLPGLGHRDETLLRIYGGQAYDIRSNATPLNPSSTTLPVRETFALGGAATLKGYQPGEFRGPGILAFGTEYAIVMPLTFSIRRIHLDVWQTAVLLFGEEGRIQDLRGHNRFWTGTALKWSGGAGLRFKGKLMNSHRSIVRFYFAQAGEYPDRGPVYYALVDVADR